MAESRISICICQKKTRIRHNSVTLPLPPRLSILLLLSTFLLFYGCLVSAVTTPSPVSSSTTVSPTYPSSIYQRMNLAQWAPSHATVGGTQLSLSNSVAAGGKFVYQFDVSVVEQFVVFNFSSPCTFDIRLWKSYNMNTMTGNAYPYGMASGPGVWNSSTLSLGENVPPVSFIVLKPNMPSVKDQCALAGTIHNTACSFFLEVINKNATTVNNYTLYLVIGQMLSFDTVADSAPSADDPTHTTFAPQPAGLPYSGALPPLSLGGIFAFDIYPTDLDVVVTFQVDPTTVPPNCIFYLQVTTESDPFEAQGVFVQQSQALDITPDQFVAGLFIFFLQVLNNGGTVSPSVQSSFQISAVRNYNADSYFGLSMFGIVGALTVLVLCLFSAAAVIARRRRAADIRAYGTNTQVGGVQMEHRPPPGASEEQIKLLEMLVYKKGKTSGITEEDDAKCSICLGDYEEGDRLKILPCKHHFHAPCIATWLKQRKHCPLCQQDIENAHDVKKSPAPDRPSSPPVSASGVQPVMDGPPPHVVPDAAALDASPPARNSSASASSSSPSSLASSASSVAQIMAIPAAHLQHVRPSAASDPSQRRVLPVNSSHVTLNVVNTTPSNSVALPIAAEDDGKSS